MYRRTLAALRARWPALRRIYPSQHRASKEAACLKCSQRERAGAFNAFCFLGCWANVMCCKFHSLGRDSQCRARKESDRLYILPKAANSSLTYVYIYIYIILTYIWLDTCTGVPGTLAPAGFTSSFSFGLGDVQAESHPKQHWTLHWGPDLH